MSLAKAKMTAADLARLKAATRPVWPPMDGRETPILIGEAERATDLAMATLKVLGISATAFIFPISWERVVQHRDTDYSISTYLACNSKDAQPFAGDPPAEEMVGINATHVAYSSIGIALTALRQPLLQVRLQLDGKRLRCYPCRCTKSAESFSKTSTLMTWTHCYYGEMYRRSWGTTVPITRPVTSLVEALLISLDDERFVAQLKDQWRPLVNPQDMWRLLPLDPLVVGTLRAILKQEEKRC